MNPEQAKKDLAELGYSDTSGSVIGTPEIRLKMGDYVIDAWNKQNNLFNPDRILINEKNKALPILMGLSVCMCIKLFTKR